LKLGERDRVRKDSRRVEAKRKIKRGEVRDILFWRGKVHLTVRRFPGNARSSFR
jgi:hypothetical protein